MNVTSATLLHRLRQTSDRAAWERFVQLYTPLLFYWGRRAGLSIDDAGDLVQEVLTILVAKLPTFEYQADRSFRGWLRTITLNKWRERGRRKGIPVAQVESGLSQVAASAADPFEEVEYRKQIVQQAIKIMEAEFEPRTWQACWQVVIEGRRASEVASDLGVSIDVVYASKSRVLSRLREELGCMLD